MTRKVLRVPQGAVNTALGMVSTTGKGATRIVKRTGKGALGITGSAIGTARNVSKTAVNTAGKVTIRATKGVTRLVKNTIILRRTSLPAPSRVSVAAPCAAVAKLTSQSSC